MDTSVIPKGMYCYTPLSVMNNGVMKIKTCPYWRHRIEVDCKETDEQSYGYCLYIGKGDLELEGGLLWDMCKECGVNEDE